MESVRDVGIPGSRGWSKRQPDVCCLLLSCGGLSQSSHVKIVDFSTSSFLLLSLRLNDCVLE